MISNKCKKEIAFLLTLVLLITCAPLVSYADSLPSGRGYYVSLQLDGSIQVNIYLSSEEYRNSDLTVSYPDETRIDGQKRLDTYSSAMLESIPIVGQDEASILGDISIAGYKKISCRIAPAQINENIELAIFPAGTTEATVHHRFTVKEIAKTYIDFYSEKDDTESEKIVNLCKTIISYGDDAYRYFSTQSGYGFSDSAANIASGVLDTKYINARLAETTSEAFEIVKASTAGFENKMDPAFNTENNYVVTKVSFICASNTNVRYTVNINEDEFATDAGTQNHTFGASVCFVKQNEKLIDIGAKLETSIEELSKTEDGFRSYYIRVKNIPAQCLGETYRVEINKDGTTVCAFYGSAMAYANRVFSEGFIQESALLPEEDDNSPEKLDLEKIMMMSAYRYYEAAAAYFGEFTEETANE